MKTPFAAASVTLITALAGPFALPPAAHGAPAAAVVEEVQGSAAGVQFMDYLAAGRVLRLGPRDTVVLAYLASCTRETIAGGTVTVGRDSSQVLGGRVERVQVACARPPSALQAEGPGAATVFRSLNPSPPPSIVLHGRAPLLDLGGAGGVLLIERTDRAATVLSLPVDGPALRRARYLDLALAGVDLAPGGIYAARLGERRVDFKVAADAQPGATPVLGRLLRLD